jgi:intein/homing endonuclease
MAKTPKIGDTSASGTPDFPTMVKKRFRDGRVVGIDNSVWLYKTVPLSPVTEARTTADAIAAGSGIQQAMNELSRMSKTRGKQRSLNQKNYRQVHLIIANVPAYYEPARDNPIREYLSEEHFGLTTFKRVLLFGVRLREQLGGGKDGIRGAIDSAMESLISGGTPLSDYDVDFKEVDTLLSRVGMTAPTNEDFRYANGWWNYGNNADLPVTYHDEHLHFFGSSGTARIAEGLGLDDCEPWASMEGTHAITFAAVESFELPYISAAEDDGRWASRLIESDSLAISIRGAIEPPQITREVMRKQILNVRSDLQERREQNKMDRAELDEKLGELDNVERAYSSPDSAPATLIDTSVLVAMRGIVEDVNDTAAYQLNMSAMQNRQPGAWAEMMIGSSIRVNPYLEDLPSSTVAYSGLPSLSNVGDRNGWSLFGLTERDRQPSYLSHVAVSDEDVPPIFLVAGSSGSGKLLGLQTSIPTPLGWTTMGDLKVGDSVIGRDGKPCSVTFVSATNATPDLYRVTLSDGQTLDADFDHQWVVSTLSGRNSQRGESHRDAIANWGLKYETVQELEAAAATFDDGVRMELKELHAVVFGALTNSPWNTPAAMYGALQMADVTGVMVNRITQASWTSDSITKTDPVVLFPLVETLQANIDSWSSLFGGNAARWAEKAGQRVKAAKTIIASTLEMDPEAEATVAEIASLIRGAGGPYNQGSKNSLAKTARKAGVVSRPGFAEVLIPLSTRERTIIVEVAEYEVGNALRALAARLTYQIAELPTLDPLERVMTTGEMLGEGLTVSGEQAHFAIRVSKAIELPEADLRIDPYTLGAWLGDGNSNGGGFAGIDPEITDHIASAGFTVKHYSNVVQHYILGLVQLLRTYGLKDNKHIPIEYLRSSAKQRLAVLQGLMDTDGTIGSEGGCELSLNSKVLADDALELIRSLGIKSSMSSGESAYMATGADGVLFRKVTGTRNRIHFTTTLPVFRLARKLVRVPAVVRETQQWLYIKSVEKIVSEPGRCIQVDSPDSTFLAAGFVPTHNTMLLLNLADQQARANVPNIIIDPKVGSDHSSSVLASGGQVISLDDLASSDGALDALRFAASPAVGVDMAASAIITVNPWGGNVRDYEVPLYTALGRGVELGATCTGQALTLAYNAEENPKYKEQLAEMIEPLFRIAQTSALFRSFFGIDPTNEGLRVADGTTLIKVGDYRLELPTPGTRPENLTFPQRMAVAVVKTMFTGAGMALTGRDGVLHQDEAWIITGTTPEEAERAGRLARSQRFLPIFYSQDLTGAIDAKLTNHVSRVAIGPLDDPVQAHAALEIARLEATPERIARITAKKSMGSTGDDVAPNWNSMRPLYEPGTRVNLRGTVFIVSDLSGRAVPVEVKLSKGFLDRASTNRSDIDQRGEAG